MRAGRLYSLAFAMCLVLGACSPGPRDEAGERISQDLKGAGRGASDAVRDGVAGTPAEDFVSLSEETLADAGEQARATEEVETRDGTVKETIAKECVDLQQSLTTLQQIQKAPPAGEIRTDEELASSGAEIERIASQIQETCGL